MSDYVKEMSILSKKCESGLISPDAFAVKSQRIIAKVLIDLGYDELVKLWIGGEE